MDVSHSNREAVEVTLDHLANSGRLELVDTALITMVRSLAAAVETSPDNAQLWKQYREALVDLLELDNDVDDRLAAALAQIGSTPTVGDIPPPDEG
jgi:hypothetical protein|tara:strand:+ start:270 stop:557 length:288 start_codon:yes stop_codon:yes gene_type:complete